MGRRRIVPGMPPGATPPVHVNYRAASSRTRTSRSNARDFIIGNISPLHSVGWRGIRRFEEKVYRKEYPSEYHHFFNSSCDELNFEIGKINLVVSSTNFSTRKISNIQIWDEKFRSQKIPKGGDEERRLKNISLYIRAISKGQS